MNKKRKKASFAKVFFATATFIVALCFVIGSDNVAKVCIGLALPSIDLNSTVKGQILNKANASAQNLTKTKSETKTPVNITKTLAYVPDDIQSLIDKAKENESSDKKDGDIYEHLYGKSSSTDCYDDILVRNASDKNIDIKSVLNEEPDLKINKKSSEPSILIFHTHTTESYQILDRDFYAVGFTSRSEDSSRNMVRIGSEITAQLQNAGFKVLHDTNIYDKKYSGAYERSGAAIDEYLKKYPSIQVILDIHRDAIQDASGNKTKPVASIGGKKAAQIMIISGCEGDGVSDFPDWQYNLRFAMKLQQKCTSMYPNLMRPLLFDNRRYNMYKSHCSLLIEIGSDSNTLDEAAYSGRLLGKALSDMLEEYT